MRRTGRLPFFLGVALASVGSRAGRTRQVSPATVSYYRIQLRVQPETGRIDGAVTAVIQYDRAARSISLDAASDLIVDSVIADGRRVTPTRGRDVIRIPLARPPTPGPLIATVYYHGRPSSGLLFRQVDGAPVVASYGLPYSARHWWPSVDSPRRKADSADIEVTVPDPLVVASNGLLRGRDAPTPGTHTYHWAVRYPIYPDVISVAIANYACFTLHAHQTSGDSLPMTFFVYPKDSARARIDFAVLPEILTTYERLFGPYPFAREKYGVAEFPIASFREHQTLPSYGASFITGDHRNDWILAHELAHQWFGNSLSVGNWSDAWLNEGFATYAAALWQEAAYGRKAYQDQMATFRKGIPPGSLFVRDSLDLKDMFNEVTFQKGAWVLHALRHVVGDSVFFAGLRAYITQHTYGNVTTEDFRHTLERTAGVELGWFFEEWVYRQDL